MGDSLFFQISLEAGVLGIFGCLMMLCWGNKFGVCFMIEIPWYIRCFGLNIFNPVTYLMLKNPRRVLLLGVAFCKLEREF